MRKAGLWLVLAALQASFPQAFVPVTTKLPTMSKTRQSSSSPPSWSRLYSVEEAERLLKLARKMREEVAALEGRSIDDVEEEARQQRLQKQEQHDQMKAHRQQMREQSQEQQQQQQLQNKARDGGRFLTVPETPDEQVFQAKAAVERAFRDGLTRQVVRFALVPQGETLNLRDRPWPGGAKQMYREAAGPLTRELLRILRVSSSSSASASSSSDSTTSSSNANDNNNNNDGGDNNDQSLLLRKPPVVKSQDIWDFDGSALITAEASTGAKDDVQALVFPNTDTKYSKDILQMDKAMGEQRLFLLVNPFWRDLESWSFNILAPKGKQLAKEAIFDRGFVETYHLLQKSVQGEDCVALKAYPYDWQLYAYAESDYWPYQEYIVHLGSTQEEPSSTDFAKLLSQRDEFKLSKNMRRMQRIMNKDN